MAEDLSQADMEEVLDDLRAENAALKKWLRMYGLHVYSACLEKRKPCICGLGALLAPPPPVEEGEDAKH